MRRGVGLVAGVAEDKEVKDMEREAGDKIAVNELIIRSCLF